MDPSNNTSSNPSRFRFRDHRQEMDEGDLTEGNTSSDNSSLSSDGDVESELETMTGKGIKRLCSELLELKKASDEDFQKNIFTNYSAFLRVFDELEGMEDELLQLKHHISTQKGLIKNLLDDIYIKILPEMIVESKESDVCEEPPSPSIFETHTNDISEILETLILEHRLDEAIVILEMEDETFQSMELQENIPADVWISYNSAMSEKRSMLSDQLTMVAENPRVSAAELQMALVGLCRLGDSNLATQLLLNYYHLRIASGIRDLQFSETFSYGVQIREVAKFVFSMISQGARSLVALHGEMSPYVSELIQWAYEETKVFATCFNKYIKSISEISGGLSTAVEAVNIAMSYCSLLEKQRIVLQPCLIKHIRLCMEDVLCTHFNHFKKVVTIFTSTDAWVLDRYLVSGILSEGSPSMVIGQQLEYCLLTNSGRKFVTLLQGITEDISSLVSLQMEGSIFEGLKDLLTEYIDILERVLINKTNDVEKNCSRVNMAESLEQQVSVITNMLVIIQFFSSIIRNVFKDIDHLKFEIDSFILFIQESCIQIRTHCCMQFIHKMSLESNRKLTSETYIQSQADSKILRDLMPSTPYQGLFSELRKLEKLAEDNTIEVDWLMDLLRELMEAIFVSISSNEEIFTINEEYLTDQHSGDFMQFILDIQFLVEIARCGGYLTDNMVNMSLDIISRMESAFVSVGLLDPNRDENENGWAIIAASEAFQKLQEIEKTTSPSYETTETLEEQTNEHEARFEDDEAASSSKDPLEPPEDSLNRDAKEIGVNTEKSISKLEEIPPEDGEDLARDGGSDDSREIDSFDIYLRLEDIKAENAANEQDEFPKIQNAKLADTSIPRSKVRDEDERKYEEQQ
ncbi:hypothetical protein LguiB_000397 [Lonicera macranthoides]